MLTKIVSGGQTGVDIAALRAAKAAGFETGGFIPKGFRTENGPQPEYATLYGLVEMDSTEYPPRTRANVDNADFTLLIATDLNSPGSRVTRRAIDDTDADSLQIGLPTSDPDQVFELLESLHDSLHLAKWFVEHPEVRVLNVAGNRDVELELPVEKWLTGLFEAIRKAQGEHP